MTIANATTAATKHEAEAEHVAVLGGNCVQLSAEELAERLGSLAARMNENRIDAIPSRRRIVALDVAEDEHGHEEQEDQQVERRESAEERRRCPRISLAVTTQPGRTGPERRKGSSGRSRIACDQRARTVRSGADRPTSVARPAVIAATAASISASVSVRSGAWNASRYARLLSARLERRGRGRRRTAARPEQRPPWR